MKNTIWVLAALMLAAAPLAAPAALAQSLTPSAIYMTSDHGMRSGKLIGMTVYNEKNEKIGVIDDIVLPQAGGEVTAVVSIGGFLGIGEKLIKVPLSHVHLMADKAMMPGDKAALMAMPKYEYHRGGSTGGG